MAYNAATVNAWYQAVQFRDGPAATVASTVALLNSGGITPANAQLSIINDSFTSTYVNPMIRIYQAAFGRVPDQAGQNFWVDNFAAGTVTTLTAATNFANSTEFNATYGANASSPINAAVLTAFYQNVLNRAPDAAGYQFWLNSGQTVAQVLNFFAQSTEFTLASASAINQFQQAEIAGNPATTGSLFQYGGFPTDSVALTTGVDTLNLLKNTTVTGVVNTTAGATDSTFQSFDTITSAAGTNSNLNVTVFGTGGANNLPVASVSGVTNINVRALGTDNAAPPVAAATTLLASNFAGGVNFNADRSTSELIINGLAAGQTVGIIGNGTTANADVTGDYLSGTTAALNLATGVTGGAAVNITGGTLKTLNVNSFSAVNNIGLLSTGANVNTVNITANTALVTNGIAGFGTSGGATINVSGGASNVSSTVAAVTLGVLDTDVVTVDASKLLNGGISATISNTAQKITGGAGNDFITTAGLVQVGAVDAGAGTADTLIVTNSAAIGTTGGAKFTNFEVLGNNAAAAGGATLDVSKVAGITSILLLDDGTGATNMTAAQAANVTNRANNSVGATLSLKDPSGAADVLNVTLNSQVATTDSADFGLITANGFETIKIAALSGGASQVNDVRFAAAGSAKALTLTGTGPIKLTTGGAGVFSAAGGVAIDASGITFTGSATTAAFEIDGELAKGSSVLATNTVDAITTSLLAVAGTSGEYVTYNAAGGDDAIASTITAINNTGAGAASLKIDGGTGTDTRFSHLIPSVLRRERGAI
jgi:S-layer protein